MKKNYKSLLTIALVLLLVAVTALTFAYWDQLTGSEDSTIDLGEGKTVTVTEELSQEVNTKLIPAGALQGENDVYEINYEYTVNIDQELAEDALYGYNLVVTLVSLDDETGLINIEIDGTTFTSETAEPSVSLTVERFNTVEVKVTLTEPGTEAEYNALQAQGQITFELKFEIKK